MPNEFPERAIESKIEITHRLQAEDLWDEATIYRNERRVQYCNAGMTRKDAHENAWDDMRLKYSPSDVDSVEPPGVELPESLQKYEPVHIPATRGRMDVARDIAWAYKHLGVENVRADQAPSGGAWSMLEYGREVRHKFLELVTKYDFSGGKDEAQEALRKDAAEHSKRIKKLLSLTERNPREAIRDALRQCPDVVVEEMRKAGLV